MTIDARAWRPGDAVATDVVIVGSGPAGLALGLKLATSYGLDVLLLEAGGRRFDFDDQSRFFAHDRLSDPRHAPADLYRRRMLGGTSTVWGGRCIPMSADDFVPRPELGRGGWPIAYDDVARYYPDALAFLDAGAAHFDAASAFPDDPVPLAPGSAGGPLVLDAVERFSLPSDVAREHRRAMDAAASLRIVLNAPCVEILTSQDGQAATGVRVAPENGRPFDVRARAVVIAAGGLETPRLLLWSRRGTGAEAPRGVGNAHDNVGRYYMTHVSGQIGEVRFSSPKPLLRLGYKKSHDGVWCRRMIGLSADTQRQFALPNFVMRPSIPSIDDPEHGSSVLSAAFLVKRLIIAEYSRRLSAPGMEPAAAPPSRLALAGRHGWNVVKGAPSLAVFGVSWMQKRVLARRKLPSLFLEHPASHYPISYDAEQLPSRANRVSLGSSRDPLGIPRPDIQWSIDPDFAKQMERAYDTLSAAFTADGIGSITLTASERAGLTEHCGAQGGHFIGTARMSATPADGVVDGNQEVWDTKGLFVAGSAVFPTSGFANPTLTIVASSLRLADILGQRLSGRSDGLNRRGARMEQSASASGS